jgi:hypothetical protein
MEARAEEEGREWALVAFSSGDTVVFKLVTIVIRLEVQSVQTPSLGLSRHAPDTTCMGR